MNMNHQARTYPLLLLLLLASTVASAQLFVVNPYLQPGQGHNFRHEHKVVVWQTDSTAGDFSVEYHKGKREDFVHGIKKAKIHRSTIRFGKTTYQLYHARLDHLDFDHEYHYRLKLGDRVMSVQGFRTRTKEHQVKFAAFGDCGAGSEGQAAIAYQVHLRNPDFVLLTGDQVYSSGTVQEYLGRFFPFYMYPNANPKRGAPLMQRIPFLLSLGNHDIRSNDLRLYPDGMAYFYYTDFPKNGPHPGYVPEVMGKEEQLKNFLDAADDRFPVTTNYAYRHGNVHLVNLDANPYVNPEDPDLVEWLRNQFKGNTHDWRIVAFHHPGFNSSNAHYNYQNMRKLSPLLEELGVDLVINGHVHNYQRSVPLKFAPEKDSDGKYKTLSDGRVDGQFTLDEEFDGKTVTRAKGIIYIVTGAGGAQLYDAEITNNPKMWEHSPKSNWVPFTKTLISDKYSFSWIETEGKTLKWTQIDAEGKVIDEFRLTR